MKIDIEKLPELLQQADGIFLDPKGEDVLLQLLDIQDQVQQAIDTAKALLEKRGLELDPNFTSIQADRVKVYYRMYGAKYYLEDDKIDQVPVDLYKVTKRYSVDTKAVDNYIEEKNGMPVGIREVERKKTLNFTRKETKHAK